MAPGENQSCRNSGLVTLCSSAGMSNSRLIDSWLSIPLDSSAPSCRRLAALPLQQPITDQGLVLMWYQLYQVRVGGELLMIGRRAVTELRPVRWQITKVLEIFDEVQPGVASNKRKVMRIGIRPPPDSFTAPKKRMSLPGCYSHTYRASFIVRGGRRSFRPSKNAARPWLVNENPAPGSDDGPYLELM
jgi:hypothetical protein